MKQLHRINDIYKIKNIDETKEVGETKEIDKTKEIHETKEMYGVKNIRRTQNIHRMKKVLLAMLIAMVATRSYCHIKEELITTSIASKIMRFHVLANSDSKEDQQLKLKVRDAIGTYMQTELAGTKDPEECRRIVEKNIGDIVVKAQETIKTQGYAYPVSASFAEVDFPDKTYGNYTFKAGEYEALQVVIGDGKGQNWWCVMYPNLCFFNSTYEVVEEEAKKNLEQLLTAEEYASIMENKEYEVRFKWLSFLNDWLED
ncbi:stage II sporulation protein R [Lachnospiraceae bacterium ZAX-1]